MIHSGARFRVLGRRDRTRVNVETLTGSVLDKSIEKDREKLEADFLDFRMKNHNEGEQRWKKAKLTFERCKELGEGYLARRQSRRKRREETKERVSRKKREALKWNCA